MKRMVSQDAQLRAQQDLSVPDSRILNCWWVRYALMGLGLTSLGLGVVGIFLPVMPSTVFFIIALWSFSKSSVRMHQWLYTHEHFGPTLQAWHHHRLIPKRAKYLAVSCMALSVVIVALFVAETWMLPTAIAAILAPIAGYIITRKSELVELSGELAKQ